MKKVILVVLTLLLIGGGAFLFKTGTTISKISTNANILGSFAQNIPAIGKKKVLAGEENNRINIAILGMRGEKMVGGGLLADIIMVVSYNPQNNTASMISIPRDLAVRANGERINQIYFDGEKKDGRGGGIRAMKGILREITGQEIHYAVSVNFAGFQQLVDALGGVTVTLDKPFVEPIQFHEEKVCDGANGGVFVVPSGNFQKKIDHRGKVVAQYPLCYNKTEECGGIFRVPAGTTKLDGARALCYVRARVTSSDFDRARRQQEVIQSLQKEALRAGTLADFNKVSAILDALGDNIRTDMELWEMQRFFDLYNKKGFPEIVMNKVLDSSEEGLLYLPEGAGQNGTAYILRPRGNNYDQIRALFARSLQRPTSDNNVQNGQ